MVINHSGKAEILKNVLQLKYNESRYENKKIMGKCGKKRDKSGKTWEKQKNVLFAHTPLHE